MGRRTRHMINPLQKHPNDPKKVCSLARVMEAAFSRSLERPLEQESTGLAEPPCTVLRRIVKERTTTESLSVSRMDLSTDAAPLPLP